jgi:hypothetical protein
MLARRLILRSRCDRFITICPNLRIYTTLYFSFSTAPPYFKQLLYSHYTVQLIHTKLKKKCFKFNDAAPTCFGLQGNHHQGPKTVLAKITDTVQCEYMEVFARNLFARNTWS